MVTLTIMTMCI